MSTNHNTRHISSTFLCPPSNLNPLSQMLLCLSSVYWATINNTPTIGINYIDMGKGSQAVLLSENKKRSGYNQMSVTGYFPVKVRGLTKGSHVHSQRYRYKEKVYSSGVIRGEGRIKQTRLD